MSTDETKLAAKGLKSAIELESSVRSALKPVLEAEKRKTP